MIEVINNIYIYKYLRDSKKDFTPDLLPIIKLTSVSFTFRGKYTKLCKLYAFKLFAWLAEQEWFIKEVS